MKNNWLIHSNGQNYTISHDELIQQIHNGNLSIKDWAEDPKNNCWSRLYAIEGIVDDLLIEYLKNDCCYGPITGRELKEHYRSSKIKKDTAVKVLGQELWHRYSLICHVKKTKKQSYHPIPPPIPPIAQSIAIKNEWTISDVLILSLSAVSLAVFLTCYYIHHS